MLLLHIACKFTDSVCLWQYAKMQGKNYIFSIKQTYRPVNPDGCSVVASKTKKNILITIAVRHIGTVLHFACIRLHWKVTLCRRIVLYAMWMDTPALHGVYVLICQAIFNRLPYMLNIVAAAKKALTCPETHWAATDCCMLVQKAHSDTQEEKHWRDLQRWLLPSVFVSGLVNSWLA